jgi:hypothetical protein
VIGHPDIEELEQVAKGQGSPAALAHVAECADCAREVAWEKAERTLFARRALPDVTSLWEGVASRLGEAAAGEAVPESAAIAEASAQVPSRRRPHWHRRTAAFAAAAAGAAVLLLALRLNHPAPPMQPASQPIAAQEKAKAQPGVAAPPAAGTSQQVAQAGRRSHLDPKSLAALDTAEADYRHAASVLEAEYQSLRPHLDAALAQKWDETFTRARTQLVESRAAVAADDVRARMRVLDGYAEYLRSLRDVIQDSEEATP